MAKIDARTTDVICMDTGERLRRVVSIDAERGEVVCQHWPLRPNLKVRGTIDTFVLRFRAVHPIYAGSFRPYLVHCYGRLQ
ncbi:hypothetical protein [Pantoea sp. 18069]|uniref:hypothetical protein n=1 Tax=Pantoea sp. 18069 TaxID=2681415 RepID=UPI00135C9A30|nr:hypothetical protein [Pantoea sp. 18069]